MSVAAATVASQDLTPAVGIFEVPITYRARRREEGKKLTTLDGLKVIAMLARCRVR
jgi:hypothetical protein